MTRCSERCRGAATRRPLLASLFAFLAALAAAASLQSAAATANASPKATKGPTPKILGGSATSIRRWPWQVAIASSPDTTPGDAYRRQFCGGSLVAPTVVITAAHCLYGRRTGFKPAERFTAITGRTRLSSSTGQEIPFAQYFFPTDARGQPLFDPNRTSWDVVVVQLAASSSSQTIQVAGADERDLWTRRRKAFVTGWGRIGEKGPFPDRLRVTSTWMISDASCRARYGRRFDPETMVCAHRRGHDTCGGDSGGPLVAPIAGGGYRLIGDTSFGLGACGSVPGFYGRLASNPMRAFVRDVAMQISGVDIVGSGAEPPG